MSADAVERGKASAAVALLALLVFVVVPGSQYLGNLDMFRVAPGALLATLAAPALLFAALAMLGLRLARASDFSRFRSVTAALALLVWIQSYLLVWDYGLFDGTPIDWSEPWWRGWVDASLWIGGLVAAARFHRRLAGPLATAALVAIALQVTLLAWTVFSQRDALALRPSSGEAASRADAMPRFSRNRNVLHIVLDSFQADVFKDVIDEPKTGPWFREALGGFTFFEENVGVFPATYYALPVMVSGQVFRNHMPREAFMEAAFTGKSILNAAHDAGYEVDLASDAMMLNLLMRGRFDNAWLVYRPPVVEEAAQLLDLGLFRAVPHWLKRGIYNGQHWRLRRLFIGSDVLPLHYFRHGSFLAGVTRRFTVDRDAPVYKFFHLMTSHEPYVMNPDCTYAGGIVGRGREAAVAQSRCSLALVIELLERMKQAGIYDDSLIVIMADHGAQLAPRRYRHGEIVAGDMTYDLRPSIVGLATPLLAIKPPGAKHPLQVSGTLTSLADVAATIDSLLGLQAGLPGTSVLGEARDNAAARSFYGFKWGNFEPAADYVRGLQEYRITGSVYDSKSWQVGDELPPPVAP